mmetsp:Transcript_49971/g.115997  ORF Transcript_49971/g.115997 Transcript_49971/m.115997 type:complete len:143 (+) Transcript_49971:209-637(+)
MTYAKHTISNVDFESPIWGSVLYTNAMATLLVVPLAVSSGELMLLPDVKVGIGGSLALVACSSLGVCMNWSGWNCRSRISAASYTLLGVASKLLSVLLNAAIWDKHASAGGLSKCIPSRTSGGGRGQACAWVLRRWGHAALR